MVRPLLSTTPLTPVRWMYPREENSQRERGEKGGAERDARLWHSLIRLSHLNLEGRKGRKKKGTLIAYEPKKKESPCAKLEGCSAFFSNSRSVCRASAAKKKKGGDTGKRLPCAVNERRRKEGKKRGKGSAEKCCIL